MANVIGRDLCILGIRRVSRTLRFDPSNTHVTCNKFHANYYIKKISNKTRIISKMDAEFPAPLNPDFQKLLNVPMITGECASAVTPEELGRINRMNQKDLALLVLRLEAKLDLISDKIVELVKKEYDDFLGYHPYKVNDVALIAERDAKKRKRAHK